MKINWNYIKGILLLALIVFLASFSHIRNSDKKIKNTSVEFDEGANLFMNFQMVDKLLIQNGATVKNINKSTLDLYGLENKILSHPMVEDASLFLSIDGILKAKIKQRTPIVRVFNGNKSYYIDKEAKRMPLSKNHSARVLVVSGKITEKDIANIYSLASKIIENNFLKKQIVEIKKVDDNEYFLLTRVGNHKILLGKIENLNQKMKNLISFYKKTMADKSIDKYKMINLKYSNQVVCTKK